MVPPLRRLLLGPDEDRFQRSLDLLFALALFAATVVAYALDFFEVAGGVVFVPGDAAIVGILAAGLLGYRRSGLALAWLVAYAPLLGYRADHAFFGLSSRSFSGQLAYFLDPEGLVVLAIEGLVLGTVGFAVGALLVRGFRVLRTRSANRQSE